MTAATSSSPSTSASSPQSSSSFAADTHNPEPPPNPHTPTRGRSKYPSSLSHDGLRVPLHRRGTSNKYERLEDLLKEAGYKETRVFTPETDRQREVERHPGEGTHTDGKLRNGIDTVIGFLAGLVPGQGDEQVTDRLRGDQEGQATPVSPSAHDHRIASDIRSTARASLSQAQRAQGRPLTSSGVTNRGPPDVHASPARAYLRHIASAPNIPRRRLLREHTPTPGAKRSTASLKDDRHTPRPSQPPMPPSWLGTVARAVLGFPGAHVGGPNHVRSHTPPLLPPGQSRYSTSGRSSTVREHRRSNRKRPTSPLEDTTARLRGRSAPSLPTTLDLLQPPTILAMHSQVSPGQVVRLNVVCRSAPTSRSSSVVARKTGSDSPASARLGNFSSGSVRGKGKVSRSAGRKRRHNNQGRLADSGPYLSCRVEDDALHSSVDWDDYNSSSEDEDDGEVDLSKLLVHARRQQSIKSLRRHLERASKPRGGDNNSSNVAGSWTLRGGDGSTVASEGRGRRRRGSVNDGDWGSLVTPGHGRDDGSLRQRSGIPVSWTQQDGNSRR